ncbi:hypothetical protein WME75_45490 [Sorangium sp. So ce1014]|uniref:hypothetical protein n=1 Tax=Sorangium sp. So ce1014 TaxID=3133326 RepID=UPI003F600611
MVIVQRQPFGVSRFFTQHSGQPQERDLGLVVPVRIQFERWLGGKLLEADAFIDSGADCTLLSYRWLETCWRAAFPDVKLRRPLIDPRGWIREKVSISIGGCVLELPPSPQLAWQIGGASRSDLREMPGFEDLLLGRDFLRHHGILLVIDREDFSLLLPHDEENRRRRDQVRQALE